MKLLNKISTQQASWALSAICGCRLVCFVVLFFASSTFAFEQTPAITRLSVDRGLLTVKAVNAPLAEILNRICRAAGIEIRLPDSLSSPVSVSFTDIPLEKGLLHLTKGYSTALFYRSEKTALADKHYHNIVKLWVLGTGTLHESITLSGHAMPANPEAPPSSAQSSLSQGDEDSEEVRHWSQILQHNPDPAQHELAIISLGQIGSDAALSAMAGSLGNKEASVRQLVVENLGLVESDLATQLLGQVLFSDPDTQIRLQALRQLALRNNEVSQAFLATAAEKQGGKVGQSARKALGSR